MEITVFLRNDDAGHAVLGNLGYVMVAFLGGIFTIKGSIQVGDIQSFFQYIRNFTNPIQQIAQVVNLLQSSAAASERVFEFLEEPEEQQTAENPLSLKNLTGDVQFEHVSFGYNPTRSLFMIFLQISQMDRRLLL